MTTKSDRFRSDLVSAVEDLLQRVNLEDRTENELDAYINRVVEDLTHDFDRFARGGLEASPPGGAIDREKRIKEERIKAAVVSMMSRHDLENSDERRIRDLKEDLEQSVVNVMGRLGVQASDGFVGETAEDMIEMVHKQDWLIQQVLVTLGSYSLSDLTAGEIRELHSEIEDILGKLDN